jgi:hypothetical protein
MKIRIITCQGTIQVLTALSVLYQHQKLNTKTVCFKNYLLIYGLFSQEDQIKIFCKTIERLAKNLGQFENICFITSKKEQEICYHSQTGHAFKSIKEIRKLLGINKADEIYLCRNQQFINILLLNAYKSAQKICYGDGIGIFYSEAYYYKTFEGHDEIPHFNYINYLKPKFKIWIFQKRLQQINFDVGYFTIPVVDALPNMQFQKADINVLKQLFIKSCQILPEKFFPLFSSLSKKKILLILTSNFSEGLRITEDNEIANYIRLITHDIEVIDSIVLKPHPRDNRSKISKLAENLRKLNKEIVILADDELFYTPIEIILYKIIELAEVTFINNVKVLCFTSAGISFPILFNIFPKLGFGKELVKNSFSKNFIKPRLQHEADLMFILTRIQNERSK